MRRLASVLLAAGMLTACNPAGEGKAVSAPPEGEAQNDAINTDANTTETGAAPAAAASSFTEEQARGQITNAGYTNVGELTQGEDGVWSGTATKDGSQSTVAVDFKGAVTTR
jgi:hypothetical protein